MEDAVGRKLRELIAEHGRSLCRDPRKLRGLLLDYCGDHRREISALMVAVEEHVAAELLKDSQSLPWTLVRARLSQRLQDNRALAADAAGWAVDTWAMGLGIAVPKAPPPSEAPAPQTAAAPGPDRIAITSPVEMVLVRIPAGEFLMGSDPSRDPAARKEEQPQHRVYLAAYYIGRTPVTNAQYAPFVRATGQQPPKHWTGGAPPSDRLQHPVVYVSWHDAVAYCRWLAQRTGDPYRLPTEAEWEKAARGEDGRVYPWGNQWLPDHANTDEAGVKGTTAVGDYSPAGDSAYGCADMAGNVWEWTSTQWGTRLDKCDFPYPYRADDGRENLEASDSVRRVLRGGAFFNFRSGARCASRYRNYPYNRYWYGGFRVVVSPSAAKRPSSAL